MPTLKSWEHFGGRQEDQQGTAPLESDLSKWALEKGFGPFQAQAKLCHDKLYARTYRSTMEVRKEFMPGLVQIFNRSRQLNAPGKSSQVSILKCKLNPMHLSVQKAYYKDKGLRFDSEAWAIEHFQLGSPKVQQQLSSYLQLLPTKGLEKEGMPANVDDAAQQHWIFRRAKADFGKFVSATDQEAISHCRDITVDHLPHETAAVVVEQYVKGHENVLRHWSNRKVAVANSRRLLTELGLIATPWEFQEAAIAHAVDVNEDPRRHADCIHHQTILSLGATLAQDAKHQQNTTPFLLRLMGPMAALRAAAVVTRHFVYLLDLDDSPATCAVLTPFACPYKAQPSSSCGSQQPVTVEAAAWSLQLGRDFLPSDLLESSAYARNKVAFIFKQDDVFHSCTPDSKSAAPPSSLQEQLGLSFLPVQFVPQLQTKSMESMKGRRAGKRKAAGDDARLTVQEASEHQACTAQESEAGSLTAQTVQQQQLAQASQPQAGTSASGSQAPCIASAAASDTQNGPSQQQLASQHLPPVTSATDGSSQADVAPEHASMLRMMQIVVAPVLQMLHDVVAQNNQLMAQSNQLLTQHNQLSAQLSSFEQMIDSNAHSYPLMAAATAQLTQETGVAAELRSSSAQVDQRSAGANASLDQPLSTPERKKLRKAEDARAVAMKQLSVAGERLDGPATSAQAAATPGQHQSTAAVVTAPNGSGVQTVYPGRNGEELWTVWQGRYASLGKYSSWEYLLKEWKEGIQYMSTTRGPAKQTVPMAQLEQDLAEGVQQRHSSSVPWRNLDRNSIRDRKIVIYGMLQAELQGKDLKVEMAKHVAAAEASMKAARKGAKTTLLTFIRNMFEADKANYLSPVEFEQKVLKWNHTPKILKQAASKQPTAACPEEDMADAAEA